MKSIFLIISLFFLIGCGSKSDTFNLLHKNSSNYEKLSATTYSLTNEAIVYIEYLKDANIDTFKIDINSRDREKSIDIISCKINGKIASVNRLGKALQENAKWMDSYEIFGASKSKKSAQIECILSNNDKFKKIITF